MPRAREREPDGKLGPMCYSSQIAAAYQQYLKLTGAAIDFDQFRELYGFRHIGRLGPDPAGRGSVVRRA
jgi:hypothetical protein